MENQKQFKDALKCEHDRKNGKLICKNVLAPSFLFYSEWVKYSDQISRYKKYFNESQIKIILYDDFKNDNFRILKSIFNFIELETNINISKKNNDYLFLFSDSIEISGRSLISFCCGKPFLRSSVCSPSFANKLSLYLCVYSFPIFSEITNIPFFRQNSPMLVLQTMV